MISCLKRSSLTPVIHHVDDNLHEGRRSIRGTEDTHTGRHEEEIPGKQGLPDSSNGFLMDQAKSPRNSTKHETNRHHICPMNTEYYEETRNKLKSDYRSHNPKVVGSNPTPATKSDRPTTIGGCGPIFSQKYPSSTSVLSSRHPLLPSRYAALKA